jgi:hypothetical protein
MQPEFYNTTNLTGDDLKRNTERAKSTNQRIKEFFRDNPNRKFSSEDVQSILKLTNPITSVRRACTNLFKDGYIIKVGKVIGMYREPITLWQKS